jgi:hypothetical protein
MARASSCSRSIRSSSDHSTTKVPLRRISLSRPGTSLPRKFARRFLNPLWRAIPIEIFEEIKEGGTDPEKDLLYAWLSTTEVKAALLLEEDVDQPHVNTCTTKGYATDLTDQELIQIGRDPFLIAYAMVASGDRCVVSGEVSAPSKQRQNRKVPDVCDDMGVQCCNLFKMMKALGFKTNWKTA